MAHFYGILSAQGRGKPVTKTGTMNSGLETVTAAWGGAIRTRVERTNGCDIYVIEHIKWPSLEVIAVIAKGILGDSKNNHKPD